MYIKLIHIEQYLFLVLFLVPLVDLTVAAQGFLKKPVFFQSTTKKDKIRWDKAARKKTMFI